MTDERIVYRTQKHWVIFLFPTLLFFLALDLALSVHGVFVFIGITPLVFAFINFKTSEFGITNKHVVVNVGFIRRHSLEVLLTKVEGIQVTQGILARILGYGTIEIGGTGGTKNPFSTINAPFVFTQAAQEQIALVQD